RAGHAPQAGGAFVPPSEPAYKLLVDQDGLYRLSYADLRAAGLPVDSLDPRTLRLFNLGSEVAIRVEGQSDARFDSGDALLFYGQAPDSEYAPENVYWLVWGQAQGLRMPEWNGSPGGAPVPASFATTQRIEENHYWSGQYPTGPDQDTWYWDLPFAYSPSTKQYNYSFSLPVPADEVVLATLRGLFYGATVGGSTNHHVQISLNGNPVKDATWPDKEAYEFEVDIPQDLLQAGENTIGIYLPLDGGRTYDMVFVNRFELDYRAAYQAQNDTLAFEGDAAGSWLYQLDGFSASDVAVYDISDPQQPALISGLEILPQTQALQAGYQVRFQRTISAESRYLALTGAHYRQPLVIELDTPSDLRAAGLGADYLVISHADFLDSLAPLLAYRAAQGLQVQLVDVQEVYDNFSDGLLDPRAIRDFLAYAYANWQPAPVYVLLVGDGNYDYKDYRAFGNTNFIPPYLADVDPTAGQVATDNYFARVSGEDILPDLHLGRLPARTAQEAGDMVAKILAYEQGPNQQDWQARLLFVADNVDKAGNFAAYSDLVVDYAMPESYQAEKVYYLETHMNDTAVRSAMTAAINDGVLLVSYVGHAGVESWAGSPVLFRISDLNALNNTGLYPFFVPMTCLEGLFFRPDEPGTDRSALAEVAVRLPTSGAIASWSADGYGVASGHDLLERGLFRALFEDGLTTLGPATSQAKIFLYTNSAGGYHDLIHTYHLFGDPALGLKVLPADLELALEQESPLVVTPGEWLTYTLNYSNAGPGTAFNLVIADPLLDLLASVDYSYSGPAVSAGSQGWRLDEAGTLITGTLTVWGQVDAQFCGVRNLDLAIRTTTLEEDLSDNQVAVRVESSQACRTFLPLANR
ncbi:MAG: hypothetical protein JW862_04165, partial [Anaerolineales bacterium]|nr:hypothetical protein [Anaerolineales bacterium]